MVEEVEKRRKQEEIGEGRRGEKGRGKRGKQRPGKTHEERIKRKRR